LASEVNPWPKEYIPDADHVFFRAHKNLSPTRQIGPNVFREHGGGMSVDWERYSSAEECRNRARSPNDNAVLRLNVGAMRKIEGLTVEHEPKQDNRAHSNVSGLGKLPEESFTQARVLLRRIAGDPVSQVD
jgi:hypothetical protein